ncbi:eIF-2-alpha kinase GCN2 isoform X3 [Hydra vulgaris]|uniref:eIF-2-alpha kinase GCN2 isoform X3 n=1 Tax=Hydra vulgaris TaxID=6087 RepID=UPI001F5F2685|nr:eIF-2-alpha kinase GCN2 isoform X4 [Hydra vulgaris]
MKSEDWREILTKEIKAIQAVYMDDNVNYSEGYGSPEIVLKLAPLQSVVGKDVHVRVDLRVLFTTRYPYDPPVLKLENAKGISNENLLQLMENLNKMALSLCGEVMVLQLAHYVQEFLHSQNVPSLSFHVQMLANQKMQETMELLEQKKLREAKYAKNEGLNSQSEKQSSESLINKFSCLRSVTPKISVVVFKKNMEKKFFCSSCVAHYFDGACTLNAIEDCSGKIFSVVQWNIKSLLKKSMEKGKMPSNDTVSRQVQLIEQESTLLGSTILFDGIISYHMLEISQDNLNIKLLVDNLNGLPLSSFIQEGGMPISFIFEISKQLIEKLKFLHSLLVIHRDLNLCNTFISSSNKLIVSGYGVIKRISDYVNMFTEDINCDNEAKNKDDFSFHSYQKKIKPGKKGDIFYMAKNKLDSNFYAVKRIPLNSKSSHLNKRIIREVKLLSRLNHENVVRYYNSWIEADVQLPLESNTESPSFSAVYKESTHNNEIDDSLNSSDSDESDDVTSTSESSDVPPQFLYIQMEFCEKQTLNTAIEGGLYKQPERVWKLFREIVEGIAHVHAQGIIHRDLKPVNIFLDSTDRIKIGDFGLATSHASFNFDAAALFQSCDSTYSNDYRMLSNDSRMTANVGTALYVAPELGQANSFIRFSQKVDIYSLGIILFEMFYHFETSMERVKVIDLLRKDEIIFPQDFTDNKYEKEKFLINWLLNHSPDSRPTALELMESGYLPPRIEDSQLDEIVTHTLSQKNSTRYQRLISAFFTQNVSPVSDQIYDQDLFGKNENHTIQQARILQYVQSIMTNIFKKHGAVFIDTPLLTPKGKNYENIHNLACVLDPSGLQLCLPVDSRLSFSRFIIRNKINHIRRYCFSKLYKDFGIKGAHPVESWDCSFDIVSNSFSSFLPEAEIMYSVYEIIKEFPSLTQRNLYIRLNHSKFIEAIFLQNGFSKEAQQEVYHILEHVIDKKQQNSMLKDFFIYLDLPEHVITRLLVCFTFEGSLAKAKESLQILCKSKAEISTLAKQAFSEIEKLIKHLKNMFVDIPVHICTSLIHNSNCYSGLIFQYVVKNQRKHKYRRLNILAVGGCYDKQIESLRKYAKSTLPHAVGVSLEVEYFLHAARKDKIKSLNSHISNCSVVVCSLTSSTNLNSLVNVIRDLWAGGISAVLYSYDSEQSYTIEDIQNYCKENNINHIVAIKDSFIGVQSREEEIFGDWRALSGNELNDYLNQHLLSKIEHRTESREMETITKDVGIGHDKDEI